MKRWPPQHVQLRPGQRQQLPRRDWLEVCEVDGVSESFVEAQVGKRSSAPEEEPVLAVEEHPCLPKQQDEEVHWGRHVERAMLAAPNDLAAEERR